MSVRLFDTGTSGNTLEAARGMLACIPAHDRDTWVRVGMAMKCAFGDAGLDAWDAWSQTAPNYEVRAAREVWLSIDPDGPVGIGTLAHFARENGWRPGLSSMTTDPSEPPSSKVRAGHETEATRARYRLKHEASKPWLACLPVPTARADDFQRLGHPEFGAPSRWWRYESAQGELMFAVARFDGPQGKAIRPASFGTDGTAPAGWRWKRPHVLLPWNLPELYARPDAPVLVCEGEKAAEAARRLLPEYVVTCGHGGAGQPKKTHWGHLARRNCLIWPDDDAASVELWAPCLAGILLDLGARVRVVDPFRVWGGGG